MDFFQYNDRSPPVFYPKYVYMVYHIYSSDYVCLFLGISDGIIEIIEIPFSMDTAIRTIQK